MVSTDWGGNSDKFDTHTEGGKDGNRARHAMSRPEPNATRSSGSMTTLFMINEKGERKDKLFVKSIESSSQNTGFDRFLLLLLHSQSTGQSRSNVRTWSTSN
jgi:hypothetical protein